MELFHGAPESMEGREPREIRAYELLERAGVNFMRTDHPDEPATSMEVCERVDAVLGVKICKNLFLCNRQKTNFYLLIMPGDKPFKTKELSGQLGISRLSFGEEQYMEQFLDLLPGSVSVLGLMNDHDRRVRLPPLHEYKLHPVLRQGSHRESPACDRDCLYNCQTEGLLILKGGILANPPASVTNLLKQAEPDLSPASWGIRFAAAPKMFR